MRDPTITNSPEQIARLHDIVMLGWHQGLAVTERPVHQVAMEMAGVPDAEPDPEWFFFRRMIGTTLIPKLQLAGIWSADLERRLEAAGCPLSSLEVQPPAHA